MIRSIETFTLSGMILFMACSCSSSHQSADAEQITRLTRALYQWVETENTYRDFAGLEGNSGHYAGLDMQVLQQRMQELEVTGFFSSAFLRQYQELHEEVDTRIRAGRVQWAVGELRPFVDNVSLWCNCQDSPDSYWEILEISGLEISQDTASYSWTWGNGFSFAMQAVQEGGQWKVLAMETFQKERFYLEAEASLDEAVRKLSFSGRMGTDRSLEMVLVVNQHKVKGFSREGDSIKIAVSGTVRGDSMVLHQTSSSMEEVSKEGFFGVYSDAGYAGEWRGNGMSGAFTVKSAGGFPEGTNPPPAEGLYLYERMGKGGSVCLTHLRDHTFYFEVSGYTESGCIGDLVGVVDLDRFLTGKYVNEGCEALEMQIVDDSLTLSETNCFDFHGASCSFEGVYRKVVSDDQPHLRSGGEALLHPEGTYRYEMSFAEYQGKSMGEKVTVMIEGDRILVIYEGDGTLTAEKGAVLDEGMLLKHKSGVWIIGHDAADVLLDEVGGCSGPNVVDFENKKFITC